jgi:hypothetical protein
MAYQKNGISYSELELRKDNPNISFFRNALSDESIRIDYGVVEVADLVVEEKAPVVLDIKEGFKVVDGVYIELTYREKRFLEYGEPIEQIEFITENGLTPWQEKVAEIKARIPKT